MGSDGILSRIRHNTGGNPADRGGLSQGGRMPGQRVAARRVSPVTGEVALSQPWKPDRRRRASIGSHNHNQRGPPPGRKAQYRGEKTAKAPEHMREEGQGPNAISRITIIPDKIAKCVIESTSQEHTRSHPPHGVMRGLKRHPKE